MLRTKSVFLGAFAKVSDVNSYRTLVSM